MRYKRVRPDIVVEFAPGQGDFTFNIHPVTNRKDHRPLARFTVTNAWCEGASTPGRGEAPLSLSKLMLDRIIETGVSTKGFRLCETLPLHLGFRLNDAFPRSRPPSVYFRDDPRVSITSVGADERLHFKVETPEGDEVLCTGSADATILGDLLWVLVGF